MSNFKNVTDSEMVSDYFHSQTEIGLLRINPCPTKEDERYRDRQVRKTESYMRELAAELERRGKLEALLK